MYGRQALGGKSGEGEMDFRNHVIIEELSIERTERSFMQEKRQRPTVSK